MSDRPTVDIQYGNTTRSFPLAEAVLIRPKPRTGEIRRQTGRLIRSDILDTPVSLGSLLGIGISRVQPDSIPDSVARAWETVNIQSWGAHYSLGPKGQTPTDLSGTRVVTGMAEILGACWYWSENTANSVENLAYFVGSTTTWTNATATADFEATAGVSGFACRGICEHAASGTLRAYAIRDKVLNNGANYYQIIYSPDKTTWTAINHTSYANSPSKAAGVATYFILDLQGILYCVTYNGTAVQLRQSTDDGTTWTDSTGGLIGSAAAPRGMISWRNASGVQQIYILLQEGIYRWTGSALVREVSWEGDPASNSGVSPLVWRVAGKAGGYLVVPWGRRLMVYDWAYLDASMAGYPIDPSSDIYTTPYRTQGLPYYRQGVMNAIAADPNFIWAGMGGGDANHTAGVYRRDTFLQWQGPIYDVATANRQIRVMRFSTADDGTPRLHVSMDNGAAGDTDQIFMEYVDRDPRTVSGYKHAPTGKLIMPRESMNLPEIAGVLRQVSFTGTAFTATEKVAAIYAIVDGALADASSGTWGTTLGSVTADAGTVSFAGTPTGTGVSARTVQMRYDLSGAGDKSPYVETTNLFVKKDVTDKFIRMFTVDIQSIGTLQQQQTMLSWLESIMAATTDLNVNYAQVKNKVMEPWKVGGAPFLTYDDRPIGGGTGGRQTGARYVKFQLVDV